MILQSLQFFLFLRSEDDLISNCCPNVKKTVSSDDVVHFIDEEINRERNYISRFCEKSQRIPSNEQHTCSIDEQHSSNIFLNPYNLWDMVPAALMSFKHTNDTNTMFNQYPQPTTQQARTHSYPVFFSLRCKRWIVKGRDCVSALHCFKEITYRTDESTKQSLRLKSWVISGNQKQWMKIYCLWRTVIVFKCSYLFRLFDFHCLLGQYLLFFRKIYFLVFFLCWLWVRSESSLTASMWSHTPLGSRSRNLT